MNQGWQWSGGGGAQLLDGGDIGQVGVESGEAAVVRSGGYLGVG